LETQADAQIRQSSFDHNSLLSQALLRTVADLVFQIDRQGFFRNYQATDKTHLAASPENFLNRSVSEVFPSNFAQNILSKIDACIDNDKVIQFEYEMELATGSIGTFEAQFCKIDNQNALVIIRNTTLYKKATQALLESEEKFRHMVNDAPALIWIADEQNRGTWFNQTWLQYTGHTLEHELGNRWTQSIHPHDRETAATACQSAFDLRESFEIEFRLKRADGNYGWIADTGIPRFSESGRFIGYIGYCWDITDRKQAQLQIELDQQYLKNLDTVSRILASTENLDQVLENAMCAILDIFNVDRAWLLYPCDPNVKTWRIPIEATRPDFPGAFADGAEFPMTEDVKQIVVDALASDMPVIHQFVSELIPDLSNQYQVKTQMIIAVRPREDAAWMMGVHVCANTRTWIYSEKRLFQEIANRITDTLSNRLLTQKLEREIEIRKNTEEELIIAKEIAESASRAKSEFLSRMSHELRTPMNAILGFAQILSIKNKDALQHEHINEILDAGKHLLELINEVLDLSKVESGKIKINYTVVDIRKLLGDCQRLIQPLADSHQVNLQIDDFDAYLIVADEIRLKQVLLNLISNAVKYNRKHGLVSLSCKPEQHFLRVEVTDNGIGISKDKQSDIFTLFERLGAEKTQIEGTGIGLAICKELIELMHGDIGFHSKVDKGTVFWIRIPLHQKA